MKKESPFSSSSLIPIFFLLLALPSSASRNDGWLEGAEPAVKRANERKSLLKTEFGEISAVNFNDGSRFGPYHLQFITLEPNSLFLPVLLHSDMVFYVHTGSGRLNWLEDGNLRTVDLRRGVVFRLQPGSIFYLQSSLEAEREKLRIYALFSSTDEDRYDPTIGAYSSITDLVRGFDKKILQESFKAPEEVIEEMMNTTKPPLIVHAVTTQSKKPTSMSWELEARFLKAFMGGAGAGGMALNKDKSKQHVYNIYEQRPDFKNCNGRSLTVTKKKYHQLKGSNVGLFYVELVSGSMMGPHWNPSAWEIGIGVSEEPGIVRVGCSSIGGSSKRSSKCKNWRFMVGKGDAFVAPKFHPMVQMSFNNGSFVFIGFSTTTRSNHPQFMAGRSSVLQDLDRKVLASSFDVNETTIDRLLAAQVDSVILECNFCAEEEKRLMEEEAKKEREEEEEARKREEEERRKREEEERKRREEEEAARKREEEDIRKREEERKRKEEEEAAARREEEEAKKREEEEDMRKREEEERKRKEEEEAAARREEEEAKKREEEEAARSEEEEAKKREEEEDMRKREEEERRRKEEEEAAARGEEEEARKREEEEDTRKREEERKRREEEEAAGREAERKRMEEEEAAVRREAERKRMEEEEERKRMEEEGAGKGGREEEEAAAEEARREAEKKREEEKAGKREEEEEWGEGKTITEGRKTAVEEEEEVHHQTQQRRKRQKDKKEEERKKKNWDWEEAEEEGRVIRILGQWT